jgi:hypothetical protein
MHGKPKLYEFGEGLVKYIDLTFVINRIRNVLAARKLVKYMSFKIIGNLSLRSFKETSLSKEISGEMIFYWWQEGLFDVLNTFI